MRLQTYSRMRVTVKELLPSTVVSDVRKEALILARFCRPYLPHLFGVVTSKTPHRIVRSITASLIDPHQLHLMTSYVVLANIIVNMCY